MRKIFIYFILAGILVLQENNFGGKNNFCGKLFWREIYFGGNFILAGNLFLGIYFGGKFIFGNLFWREIYFGGKFIWAGNLFWREIYFRGKIFWRACLDPII
jgi:hypothetical protein